MFRIIFRVLFHIFDVQTYYGTGHCCTGAYRWPWLHLKPVNEAFNVTSAYVRLSSHSLCAIFCGTVNEADRSEAGLQKIKASLTLWNIGGRLHHREREYGYEHGK